jgi:flagellar basal-body rod protein FlgF
MDALSIAAASGLRSRIQSLDLLANNLANTGTAGFKRDAEYYSLFSGDESTGGETLPMIQKQWTDFSQGTLQVTSNPSDVALTGDGFLVVKGPNGPLYTRNGSLQTKPDGTLTSSEGYPLLDTNNNPIVLAQNQPYTIGLDGGITQNNQPVATLQVVQFPNQQSLAKLGAASFQNSDVKKNVPKPATDVQVQQGKLEGSNVPVADAAMHLVGVMRQFEMLQKAVGISGEMDTKTIQEVARVSP